MFKRAASPLMRMYDVQTQEPGAGSRTNAQIAPEPRVERWNAYFPTAFGANYVSLKGNQPGATDATGVPTSFVAFPGGFKRSFRATPHVNQDVYLRHRGTPDIQPSAPQIAAFKAASGAYVPNHAGGPGYVTTGPPFGSVAFGAIDNYLMGFARTGKQS